jgi:ankyrin repeat protein
MISVFANRPRPRTALHRAVDMNNSAMVMQLLRLGADPLNIQARIKIKL